MTRTYWANMALCIFIVALAIFSVSKVGSVLTPKGLFVTDPQPSHEAVKMLDDVVLTKYQLGESVKNKVEAVFYIQNKTDQDIKNINVLCEFFDEKGMYRDRKTWLLAETVPAMHVIKISSETRRFVNTGAQAMNCSIADFQVVKEPIFSLDRHEGSGHGQTSEGGQDAQPAQGH